MNQSEGYTRRINVSKHILVVAQYYYPELFRINDLTSEWVKRGYKVTVLTGIPNYPQGKYFDGYGLFKKRKDTYNGASIIRIPLIARGHSSFTLMMNYLSFVISGFFWKSFTNVKADYVFIFEVSPMTQALVGVWYAKRRKIPCYLYVQDLWPENVEIMTGIKNKSIINMIGNMVDYIYKGCNKIFTTSRSFIKAINSRGFDESKLEYWPQYAEDFCTYTDKMHVAEIAESDSFDVIFAGNIGNAQGLDILVQAAQIIKKDSEKVIRFVIVGDGRYKEELINLIDNNALNDMFLFIPKQPSTRIPEFVSVCDAAFLSLADNPIFEMTIPAKLQTYMSCGKVIIASAAGETQNIIKEANCGLCSKPGDSEVLAENILLLAGMTKEQLDKMGLNASEYCRIHFSKDVLLEHMDYYFNL